jgi:hypothetical protein
MQVEIELTGQTPLLMHNPHLVDPEFPITREIKALSAKRKKTDEDYAQIALLEWRGGLYVEDGVIVEPVAKVRKCLVEAARISKQGKDMERALILDGITVPLDYDGPTDLDELYATPEFVSRLSVGVRGNRVMRTRPQFMPWALKVSGVLIQDAGLNFEHLEQIAVLGGRAIGIGDNRVNGYGRFDVKVEAGS